MQDTLGSIAALATIIYKAVPWLVPGSIMSSHPSDPYQGPKPYAVINSPHNSRAHRESMSVGNRPGQPNRYTVAYYETPFTSNAQRIIEELRVYQTYDALSMALVTAGGEDGDIQVDLSIMSVELDTIDRGPWVVGPGNVIYIGCLIHIDVETRYSE